MYEEHPEIVTPSDETVLWRYVNLERLIALLCDSELFLCRLDRFRDPWEGVWPRPIVEAMRQNWPPQSREMVLSFTEQIKTAIFVNCWHAGEHESAALWDLYSGQAGIAIRTTRGRLKSSISSEKNYFLGKVSYCDYASESPPGTSLNMLIPPFLKRKSFEHEREVRILTWHLPFKNSDEKSGFDWSQTREFDSLKVVLADLIESIYISPTSPSWFPDYIKKLLTKFELPDVTVISSDLYDRCVY